ncbi:MAG: hydrocarbon degradation protein [Bacteroidales bacterium]|nr:hydrocarbon degradation protein [Bacteroidales bacterium]
MTKSLIFSLLFAVAGMSVFAGGYQVRLQGNKSTGMGLTGTALNLGSSSIFYNPGALSLMKNKTDFSIGASGILSRITFEKSGSQYQAETDNPMSTPLYVYGAGKISDKWTVGLGVYTPFGSSTQWDNNWAGKFLIQNISLKAIYVQPTVAYKINDKLGVGAGFVYAHGTVKLAKGLNYGAGTGVELEGTSSNMGFNVGVFYTPTEKLSLGVDYRSKILAEVKGGDATFTIPQSVQNTIPAQNKFDATLPMPGNLDFGVSYQASEKMLVSFEVNWVMWSAYDTLKFEFEEKGEILNSSNPRKYKDTFIPRLGFEYKLNDMITLRAGGYYDQSPTDDDYFNPETVSLNTLAFTLGMSINPTEKLSIDLSYLQLTGQKTEKTYSPEEFGGTYKSAAYIPGIGVSYHF